MKYVSIRFEMSFAEWLLNGTSSLSFNLSLFLFFSFLFLNCVESQQQQSTHFILSNFQCVFVELNCVVLCSTFFGLFRRHHSLRHSATPHSIQLWHSLEQYHSFRSVLNIETTFTSLVNQLFRFVSFRLWVFSFEFENEMKLKETNNLSNFLYHFGNKCENWVWVWVYLSVCVSSHSNKLKEGERTHFFISLHHTLITKR
jgi:hypothetical protein